MTSQSTQANTKTRKVRYRVVSIETLHRNVKNRVGETFGYRKVLAPTAGRCGTSVIWKCRCVCGRTCYVLIGNLKKRDGSCGCKKGELLSRHKRTHGMSGRRVWRIWKGMVERCHKTYGKSYSRYGGAGIAVCRRWRGKSGFQNFLTDMGDPGEASKLTLDRKKGNLGYCKSNCRWATQTEQHRNRTNNRELTARGQTRVLAAWVEISGVPRSTIARRIDVYGWDVERAIFTPARKHGVV